MNLQQRIVEDIKQYEHTHQAEGRDWGEWARLITFRKIFPNYRRGKGLRVSRDGLHFLKKLYDSYEIHIKSSKPVKTRDIVLLEKHRMAYKAIMQILSICFILIFSMKH